MHPCLLIDKPWQETNSNNYSFVKEAENNEGTAEAKPGRFSEQHRYHWNQLAKYSLLSGAFSSI